MTCANAATLAKAQERLAERYSGETVEIIEPSILRISAGSPIIMAR